MKARNNRGRVLILATTFAMIANHAQAHLVNTGLGPVYDGIGHFLLSPDDVLPAVALGILAGLRGKKASRWALAVLPVAWFAGGLLGNFIHAPASAGQATSAVSLMIIGLLVALDRELAILFVSVIAFLLGAAHGFFNGLAMKEAGTASAMLQLLGVGATLFVIVAVTASLVVPIKKPVARIIMRVSGSWVAAIGLLLLGWSLRIKR